MRRLGIGSAKSDRMNIGLYQSAASLSALERWQDVVAQNITSSQTTGFRKRTVQFSTQTAGEWRGGAPGMTEAAVFPKVTTGINLLSGETQTTRRGLDVAIQGEGFFELRQPDGQLTYTRSGEFALRSDRTLVAAGNAEVLTEDGSPVVLLSGGGALEINADGTLRQGTTPLGKLAIRQPANPAALIPLSGGLFLADPTAGMKPVEHPELMQGYLEQSNVSSLREMVDLVVIARAYEANQRVIGAMDQQMQKALEAFG